MTLEQVLALTYRDEVHLNGCTYKIGPRGGVKETIETWRVNGRIKRWKRDTNAVRVPIKYGFRGPHGYIDEHNMGDFHLPSECPNRVARLVHEAARVTGGDIITVGIMPMAEPEKGTNR